MVYWKNLLLVLCRFEFVIVVSVCLVVVVVFGVFLCISGCCRNCSVVVIGNFGVVLKFLNC